jgi:hypothetical protein
MGEIKKILFLDIDGVLALSTEWGGRFKKQKLWNKLHPDNQVTYVTESHKMDVEFRFDNFNPKAVTVLNEILELTDAEIVISSDWRFDCSVEEMQSLFRQYGVNKVPIDYTPTLEIKDFHALEEDKIKGYGAERAMEIKKWLEIHPQVTHWVAVDDIDMTPYLDNFVHTPRDNEGIKQSGVKDRLINFLI